MQSRPVHLTILLLLIVMLLAACRPGSPDPATATAPPASTATTAPAATDEPTPTEEPAPTDEPVPTPEATPTAEVSDIPDLEPLREDLATRLELPLDSVVVESAALLPSPDLCLGIYDDVGPCYRATLLANGTPYNYHINDAGDFTGLVDVVPAGPGEIILSFGTTDCQVAALRLEDPTVGLGPCGSEFTFYNFAGDAAAAQAELQRILDAYVPFNAVTVPGFLSVGGSGAGDPSPQEREDIAAWVRNTVADAVAQGPAADALCTRLGRPALVTQSQGSLAIGDPFSGQQCDLALPGEFLGAMHAAGGFLYFQDVEGSSMLIREMSPDGTLRPLEFTRIDTSQLNLLGFALSPDGQTIAWSTAPLGAGPGLTSSLHVGATHGDTAQTIVEGQPREDGRALIPLRFDAAGQTLVYTLQPMGIGGAWPSFVGRYDSLFTIPVTGGEPLQLFDCRDLNLLLCIGDFQMQEGGVQTFAYVRENNVEVLGQDGAPLATITLDAEYVAYPTFSPAGDLVLYAATIGEAAGGSPFAMPGAYYHVAPPYSGEPALVASQDGLLTPYQWFDDRHLIVGLGDAAGMWGTALLALDGSITPLEPWPNTAAVTVIR